MKIFASLADSQLRDDPPSNAGGATADAAQNPSQASPPGGGETPPAAASPDGTPAASTPYRPEGLPEHFLGANDRETMDKMSAALAGFRKQISDVPDKPEAYKDFGEVDPALKPYMDTLTGDKLFDGMTSYAKENNIPKGVFQGMVSKYIGLAAEMGMLEPPIDVARERELLTPEAARHLPEADQAKARDQRMADNFAFLDLQVTKDGGKDGGLSKEAADFAKAMLGDRAVGHEFIEFLRARTGGGGKGPLMDPNGGIKPADPKADIERRRKLPENTWGDPAFDRQSYDKLQQDAKAIFG